MILLWGTARDGPLSAVGRELERLGAPVAWLDQRHTLQTEVALEVGAGAAGWLRAPGLPGGRLDLAAVGAVYARPEAAGRIPVVTAAGPAGAARRHAAAIEDALCAWADLTPALVVNRPEVAAANGSKPYQLERIRRLGFQVPDTLVTTDPAAARAFWERHGAVVYKSVSGRRSRVSRLRPEHAARLANVAHCPTQFQERIPGRDYRVHVAGAEALACEVLCDADDYRYPGDQPVAMRAVQLPPDVADRCRQLAAALGLAVAGIDLRRHPDGRWYCFEANPSPAFTYYEARTGQPIGRAIARLLVAGARRVLS